MTLKQLRKDSGIKQYKIAETLNISRVHYGNIENGSCRLSADKIEKLAKIFGVDPLEIVRAWEESEKLGKNRRSSLERSKTSRKAT